EEKQHPELIKAALNLQLPLDMTPFEVHLGNMDDLLIQTPFNDSATDGVDAEGEAVAENVKSAATDAVGGDRVESSAENILARVANTQKQLADSAAQIHQQQAAFVARLGEAEQIIDV
ncbi:unnamed protein product, partial [Symbiodinium microadriaticum]